MHWFVNALFSFSVLRFEFNCFLLFSMIAWHLIDMWTVIRQLIQLNIVGCTYFAFLYLTQVPSSLSANNEGPNQQYTTFKVGNFYSFPFSWLTNILFYCQQIYCISIILISAIKLCYNTYKNNVHRFSSAALT